MQPASRPACLCVCLHPYLDLPSTCNGEARHVNCAINVQNVTCTRLHGTVAPFQHPVADGCRLRGTVWLRPVPALGLGGWEPRLRGPGSRPRPERTRARASLSPYLPVRNQGALAHSQHGSRHYGANG